MIDRMTKRLSINNSIKLLANFASRPSMNTPANFGSHVPCAEQLVRQLFEYISRFKRPAADKSLAKLAADGRVV